MSYDFDFIESGYTPSYDFDFGYVPPPPSIATYSILAGLSNNFVAIWADPIASLAGGKMHVSSSEAFSIVDLNDKSLYDYYTTTHKGRSNEFLESDTVIDLNVA